MRLDGKIRKDIQGAEEEIHKRISVSSTRFRQKMRIEVNILDYAIEGVLSIEYKDGK